MKSKKLKLFLSGLFALSLGLSVITFSRKANEPEIVSVEAADEDPVSSNEDPNIDSSDDQETPVTPSEETPETPEEPAEGEEESAPKDASETPSVDISAKGILKMLIQIFKDAWKDLVAHIKRWFKL